jgi:tight adherence protein B
MPALFWAIFGFVLGIVLVAAVAVQSYTARSQKRTIMQRLSAGESAPRKTQASGSGSVLYEQGRPAAKKTLVQWIPGVDFIGTQITAAGLDWSPSIAVLSMASLAIVGMIIGSNVRVLLFPEASAAALALVLGSLPYLYIARKRKGRLHAFESQFPDTLDFIARAVRAGHAFSISLELLANDSPEPTRTEFRRVFTEHNLGATLESALTGLIQRVPLVDVRFFVSAVLLQRETGGNLSEILTNLGDVIRERFQLKGRVRAASAHGRITATALTIIPIVLLGLLELMRPNYLQVLTQDHHGRIMLWGALIGQITGYLVMKKIINIKV